jgi:hypothetical protein
MLIAVTARQHLLTVPFIWKQIGMVVADATDQQVGDLQDDFVGQGSHLKTYLLRQQHSFQRYETGLGTHSCKKCYRNFHI